MRFDSGKKSKTEEKMSFTELWNAYRSGMRVFETQHQ